jgi:(p)ppGpp synthase/HD superfamily hydrolase
MADRVDRTAAGAGVDRAGRELIAKAMAAAMAPRLAAIDDDHHPDYLHPGRTAVILLDDVGLADPLALAAACLLDTRRSDFEPSDPQVTEDVSPAVTAFRVAVPRSGSVTLLEDLLASEPEVVLVALAERLDQVRHAHFWGDRSEALAAHQEAADVYLKMAERANDRLAARYNSWCRAFKDGYLRKTSD